ncbi:MAG: VIT1/CCC1 transporter family protein [Methanotrichaceae archaeon]|nr:VIT1/CCC1 transporter family protein [Methanotrichaceae archaeon]
MTENATKGSIICRMKESLRSSSGEIVFGMSDGAVSIFGLVLGVAAGAQSGNAVFLAGATGAIAASVSMMAGLYLDLESERDETRVETEQRESEIRRNPDHAVNELMSVLQRTGLSTRSLDAIRDDMQKNPLTIRTFEDAVACEEDAPAQTVSPIVHACWMGLAGFVAGITPVIPFAFLPFAEARIVCVIGTAALLILLGGVRAWVGNRSLVRTVLETIAIATAAALAGILIGRLIS